MKRLTSSTEYTEELTKWILTNLSPLICYLEQSFVFGSIARGSQKPNDCDLMIVSKANWNEKAWFHLRKELKSIQKSFKNEFGIELSIILMTSKEYQQELQNIERRFVPRIVVFS